ncbi:MAG TPA: sulfite exporter TauE/SafE family protein [Gemmatimonadaceae bacterium]|nr:sulfite exporter TauE/SafE family protein [Gemmatimonadaceae bacterium]
MDPTTGSSLAKNGLFLGLGLFTIWYLVAFIGAWRRKNAEGGERAMPTPAGLLTGFGTNFFDTLGIGSFAPTTSIFRFLKMVPDEHIPGTLNVGHTLPVIAQAYIFTRIVPVEMTTMILMILAAVLGAWIGAGLVSSWPRRTIQIGMGLCLLAAAALMAASQLQLLPSGGTALGVDGIKLAIAVAGNFLLGALMTLGIGLYAPSLVMISLLGMNVQAAFPIMMGSCAFLQPVSSARFIRAGSFDLKASLGLAIAGLPAVLIAAFIVRSLPLGVLRWLVVCVVLYTAATLLLAARRGKSVIAPQPAG